MPPSSLSLSALLQAATSTSAPVDYWGIAGRALTALIAVGGGAFLFTWRAIGRAWFCAMLKHCETDLKATIEKTFAPRIVMVDAAVDAVGVHADQLEGLEASMLAQGEALTQRLSENTERQTEALLEITKSLQVIQRDGNMTSSAVQRIEGFLDGVRAGASGWAGGDRREGPSR